MDQAPSIKCGLCKRVVVGLCYPDDHHNVLWSDCGEKEEAAYWNKVIIKRDGGPA